MTPPQKPLTAIIILNWNLPSDTAECINSILASKTTNYSIIIVDNNSSDDSIEQFKQKFGTKITLLQNQENLGFAAGVNVGIQYALKLQAEYIILLNNDTIVDSNMIEELKKAAAKTPEIGLLSPAVFYADTPEKVWRYGDNERPWLPIPLKISTKETARHLPNAFQLDYITFCCALIKRQVFEHIGLLDERFFMYFEDADFCRRTREAKFKIYCVPKARMWHKVSLSAVKDKPRNRYERSWGRLQFFRTHPHGFLPTLFYPYLLGKLLATSIKDILTGDPHLLRPLWLGTIKGFRYKKPQIPTFQPEDKHPRKHRITDKVTSAQ